MSITAKNIGKLREITGAGMMDCKIALTQAEGNLDDAIDILRKRGQKISSKRSDRDALEGVVFGKTNSEQNVGILLALSCETDFVAKNDTFRTLGDNITDLAIKHNPSTIKELSKLPLYNLSVEDSLIDHIGKIGEKIEIKNFKQVTSQLVVSYIHSNNTIGVLIGLNGYQSKSKEVLDAAKSIAMQVAAMNPLALSKDDIDSVTIERELAIAKEQASLEGKPKAVTEKIAQGKLNKFFKDNTLLMQPFIKDSSLSVTQFLNSIDKNLSITGYARVSIK